MKILITDYPDVIKRDLDREREILQNGLPGCEVEIFPYRGDREELKRALQDTDAVLTAFLNFDEELLSAAGKLKCICFNATGYDFVDYNAACRHRIGIVPIGEYCTGEVADHTMALILALERGLKHYIRDIDERKNWQYYSGQKLQRLDGMKLGIFGFGKIGRAVAARAAAFGIRVYACDPGITAETAEKAGAVLVDEDYLLEQCDIISNHMNLTEKNRDFFNRERFRKMKKHPVFINVSRGGAVDEDALAEALDSGTVSAAGLDVLRAENPDLETEKLVGRENVIMTPHAAFYTEQSLEDLQRISCENVVHYLREEYDQVNKIVNRRELGL